MINCADGIWQQQRPCCRLPSRPCRRAGVSSRRSSKAASSPRFSASRHIQCIGLEKAVSALVKHLTGCQQRRIASGRTGTGKHSGRQLGLLCQLADLLLDIVLLSLPAFWLPAVSLPDLWLSVSSCGSRYSTHKQSIIRRFGMGPTRARHKSQ